MNQEKEWWDDEKYYTSHEFNGVDVPIPDVQKIATEATRRGELKAWEKILAEIKAKIKDHQIVNIGDHHDAEGLTKAYHLAYKEMRKNAEDRITDLESL